MRQFHSCQMCHNQWIPAYSHQSPAQPLSAVCCAGAKRPHTGPLSFCPLFCWAEYFSLPAHIWFIAINRAHTPLKSAGIMVKRGHQRLCVFLTRESSRVKSCCVLATLQYLMSLHQHRQSFGLCLQVSMQQGECGAGKCAVPGKMASKFLGHIPLLPGTAG